MSADLTGFAPGVVRVSVPATSANLGPGFDSLGLALHLRDQLEAEVQAEGLTIEVTGNGADAVPLDEGHLVVRAMRAVFAALEQTPPGLRLECQNVIPHGRGLGSSAAAIVGGAVLARALVVDGPSRLDDDELLHLAAELEGHPDNVAPALLGGFVVSGSDDGRPFAARSAVDPRITTVAFVPPDALSTETSRGLLPDVVPHADAAANAGRAALLVTALAGRPDLLWLATRDRLHQGYRGSAMPASLDLVEALRADGVAAVVSGAGPTVLALVDRGVDGRDAARQALVARCPDGWQAHQLEVDVEGARVG